MRLSKLTKKGVSVALALSMVVAGTAGMTQKASAAKKFTPLSKSVIEVA